MATCSKKLQTIRESDTISFHKSEILNQELLNECASLYIAPMVDELEVKRTIVDNVSAMNVCSNYFLTQLQEKDVTIPPLEEAIFKIRAYDSSSKKPLGIATIMITTGVRTIPAKFQVVDLKLSYNMLLGRSWIHDMEVVASTLHGRLKFEFQGEVHTILANPKPYALCNVADFEEMALVPPLFKIEPLDDSTSGVNTDKQVQIIETSMGTYKIDDTNLFASIKDLG